jgi:hypothetical protein
MLPRFKAAAVHASLSAFHLSARKNLRSAALARRR